MKSKILTAIFFLAIFCVFQPGARAQTIHMIYCASTYDETGQCPSKTCTLTCAVHEDSEDKKDCVKACLPADCEQISIKECPPEYCIVMTDCSNGKICHDPMQRETPECGDLSYEGQDVECCEGLVKRCGIEFLEGFCDMEGKYSVYNLPICIPCGDGICGQFENRCNCPEDCGKPLDSSEVIPAP